MVLEGLASIRGLTPLEEGGAVARTGFIYQDHVAAGFCLDMLANEQLREIWCEAEDDVTLIWLGSDGEWVELVQVKSDKHPQLWSVALICEGHPASIAAKSLAHDRCAEPCRFRLVTQGDIHPDLAVLKLPIGHEDRTFANPKMKDAHEKVSLRMGNLLSLRQRGASHWIGDLVWTVAESEAAIRNANLIALERWLEDMGEVLFSDQRDELYDRLLRRIMTASCTRWRDGPETKKLLRDLFIEWLKAQVAAVKGVSTGKAGEVLRFKMTAAGLELGVIDMAEDIRRRHRRLELDPKYMGGSETADMESEALAILNQLVSQLDRGSLDLDGVAFHSLCLDALAGLRASHPEARFAALQAVMYIAADRCRHRFVQARV
ncbi:hypothetical protein ER13_02185 [Brevundimonas sp. EAKA]|uniref:dsDNA nuclease domain-containing protein n=1 Tax=Brevundimonas sp. EAKA TaxID=1495854 RepID=UPI0004A8F952|nr:dsDNA nuclease domain-containing protein [Brevundimonas sp. EAKA]KDP95406.1 hypothetical protein ER13_02185 [Brevundimonas sp. EAKA]